MKIKRSDLPESIAAALEPRTFAQERPEEGVIVDLRITGPNNTFGPAKLFGNWWASIDCHNVEELSDDISAIRAEPTDLWRPFAVLELEDEAPEPQRELPEPGSYFLVNGRIAYRSDVNPLEWQNMTDTKFQRDPFSVTSIKTLPDNWQSLSGLIAKAARCDELEAQVNFLVDEKFKRTEVRGVEREVFRTRVEDLEAKCSNQRTELGKQNVKIRELQEKIRYQNIDLEHRSATIKDYMDKGEELQAKIKQLETTLTVANQNVAAWKGSHLKVLEKCDDLQAKIKQQDAMFWLANEAFMFNEEDAEYVGFHANELAEFAKALREDLEARRKAREASE